MARGLSQRAHSSVLEAALELFAERGIDATSVDAIAGASGVSKATIYKHWADKDALAMEVLVHVHELDAGPPDVDSGDLEADLVAYLLYEPPKRKADLINRLMPHLIAHSARNPEFGRAWRSRVLERARTGVKKLVRRGMDRGLLPTVLDDELAVPLLLGPMMFSHILGPRLDRTWLATGTVESFWKAHTRARRSRLLRSGVHPHREADIFTNEAKERISEAMMNHYLDVAVETALEAGKILREEFDRPPDISYKGDVDLVTQADQRSEQAIVARLSKYFPQHTVSAEEGLGHERSSEYRWHVDPLDGTTNFAHKYPCFSVSIALAQNGVLLAGVVYNPIHDELFAAAAGQGATLNGKRISVSQIPTLATSLLCTGFPVHKRLANPNIHYYYDFTLRSHGVRRDGSAALDLASVAAGRFDGFWEFGLKPWDTAAGVLLVREAGGTVSDFQGGPYTLGGPVVLATNSLIHEEMRKVALAISERDPNAPLQAPLQTKTI